MKKKTNKKISGKGTKKISFEEDKTTNEAVPAAAEKEIKKPINYSKQTGIVVLLMAVVLLAIAGGYWIAQRDKVVDFNGIEFQQTKEGTLIFYKSLMGYITSTGEEIPLILKLRINPEKLKKIPVEGKITGLKEAIISISPQVLNCSKTYISVVDLSMTLKAFGTTSVGATNDKDYAVENNVSFADCNNSTNKTVIIFKEGPQTKIYQDEEFKNCLIVDVNNCEVREGYERFLLAYIQDSYMK